MAIGFIGLGVMGEPMCLNLIERLDERSHGGVVAFDLRQEPLDRVVAAGGSAADSVADVAARCETVLLSLPGGPELEKVVAGPDGLLSASLAGRTVVDHTTAPVALTRDLADRVIEAGGRYLDAPVARTRQAARDGTLSIMVGGSTETFEAVAPILSVMGTDVTRCGGVGAGQVTKLLNNMMLFQNVRAVAEAHAIATGLTGAVEELDVDTVFGVIAGASGGSFALSNHGMKSVLPDEFPLEAFSTVYALKDLGYALDLAAEVGVDAVGAETVGRLMEAARAAGFEDEYFPVLRRML